MSSKSTQKKFCQVFTLSFLSFPKGQSLLTPHPEFEESLRSLVLESDTWCCLICIQGVWKVTWIWMRIQAIHQCLFKLNAAAPAKLLGCVQRWRGMALLKAIHLSIHPSARWTHCCPPWISHYLAGTAARLICASLRVIHAPRNPNQNDSASRVHRLVPPPLRGLNYNRQRERCREVIQSNQER